MTVVLSASGLGKILFQKLRDLAVHGREQHAAFFDDIPFGKDPGPSTPTLFTRPVIFNEFTFGVLVFKRGADRILQLHETPGDVFFGKHSQFAFTSW